MPLCEPLLVPKLRFMAIGMFISIDFLMQKSTASIICVVVGKLAPPEVLSFTIIRVLS